MSLYRPVFSLLRKYAAQNVSHLRLSERRSIKRWVAPTLKELYRRRVKVGPEPEKPRSAFLEWNYDSELFAFGKRLGEEIDRDLLKRALIQKEFANLQEIKAEEKGLPVPEKIHNFALIGEGDKIISTYVRAELRKTYPEDIVNAVSDYLTSEDMLSHIASHIGLKDIILTTEFPVGKSTLSNTFKAIVAALKQSQSLERADNFVKDFVMSQLNGKDVYEIWDPKEPFEYLMKLLREKGVTEVEPRLCNQSATNTILACFQVGLYSDKKLLGLGWGENIQIAKETAAIDAIQRIYSNYTPK
nr:39S ribosomal protein L44, mitochondrial isoform X1 [Leptinotarsa decemlineata]XP_023014772.1 39S ribosomal protein L44, mitochondrial isoform X2 [Leptinotarsa decemlineata]